MNFILNYMISSSNYSIMNKNNVYNAILLIWDCVEENKKKNVIMHIKTIIGLSFFDDFICYIQKKCKTHDILKYI